MSLKDPIHCVLEHMGERPYRACRNVSGSVRIFQAIEKWKMQLLHTVIQPFSFKAVFIILVHVI